MKKQKKIKIELTDEEWKYVWQAVVLALGRATELKAIRRPYYEFDVTEAIYIKLRDKIWKQWKNRLAEKSRKLREKK